VFVALRRRVRQLHDPVEQFLGGRTELRGIRLLRLWDGFDKRRAVKRVDLMKVIMGTIKPLHAAAGAMGPRTPMTTSMSLGLGQAESLPQQIDIRRIARIQQIGFQPLNAQHPTELPHQVAIFRAWTVRHGRSVDRFSRRCPSVRIAWANSLSRGKVRETRFDTADA